jgi:hypothetical protein
VFAKQQGELPQSAPLDAQPSNHSFDSLLGHLSVVVDGFCFDAQPNEALRRGINVGNRPTTHLRALLALKKPFKKSAFGISLRETVGRRPAASQLRIGGAVDLGAVRQRSGESRKNGQRFGVSP